MPCKKWIKIVYPKKKSRKRKKMIISERPQKKGEKRKIIVEMEETYKRVRRVGILGEETDGELVRGLKLPRVDSVPYRPDPPLRDPSGERIPGRHDRWASDLGPEFRRKTGKKKARVSPLLDTPSDFLKNIEGDEWGWSEVGARCERGFYWWTPHMHRGWMTEQPGRRPKEAGRLTWRTPLDGWQTSGNPCSCPRSDVSLSLFYYYRTDQQ